MSCFSYVTIRYTTDRQSAPYLLLVALNRHGLFALRLVLWSPFDSSCGAKC